VLSPDGSDTLTGVERFVFDDWSGEDLDTAPEALALSAQRVAGSARVGDVVAVLSAHDAEADPLHFTLVSSTGDALRLDGDRLVLARSPSAMPGEVRLVVEAADGYGGVTRAEFTLATEALDMPPVIGGGSAPGAPAGVVLRGGSGRDSLWGMAGDDRLVGGPGADSLHGGAGADTFVFAGRRDSVATANGRDTVFDFSRPEGDRIDLAALDADATSRGNQTFTWIGSHGFHEHAGELRAARVSGGVLVSGDTDGDGVADLAIRLKGIAAMLKGDFVL
jgi:hypothetical protein